MKTCRSCGQTLSLDAFYKHPRMADGYLNHCKECKKSYQTKHSEDNIVDVRQYDVERAKQPHRKAKAREITARSRKRNPATVLAHQAVAKAVHTGALTKLPCEECGRTDHVHAHHDDYEKPLAVIWLCPVHHRARHKLLGWG